jgi:hypothetical protein
MHDGRLAFPSHAPMGEYTPQTFPYNGEGNAQVLGDRFVRPPLVHSTPDGHSFQLAQGFGPPTPHHGSHSSVHADEAASFQPFPQNNSSNHQEAAGAHQQHPLGPSGVHPPFPQPPDGLHGPPFPPIPPQILLQLMEIHVSDFYGHMRGQFQDSTFSDCTLVLRYLDDRTPPIRLPSHRVILARSEPLKRKMIADPATHVPNSPIVLLEVEDPFVRSSAFISAVQHLYGFPLFSIPDSHPGSNDNQMAGNRLDQFNFVLGYTASGYLLGLLPIVIRGLEMACQLLSWKTLERALHFTVERSLARDIFDEHPHGNPIDILLNGISSFLLTNFPPNFALDVSVADPATYSRLPFDLPAPSTVKSPHGTLYSDSQGITEIGAGSCDISGPSSRGKTHRPQLSKIQFGDMPEKGDILPAYSNTFSTSSGTPSANLALLSRVLLNIPFPLLKKILESDGQGNVTAWANAEARHQALRSVVEAREVRRLNAVDAVKKGLVDIPAQIQVLLASPEPPSPGSWDVLGWREELIPYGNPDKPCLGRSWTPLVLSNGGSTNPTLAAYP